ncbi:hypothetical protein ABIB00_006329 [Bradyrhizobium sp. LB14.3]|uniref:hypothetical protein n=1 Tax=Bradyrhizobium sp. LB14.3 TaxID=3156328 RepID=UPI00339A0D39
MPMVRCSAEDCGASRTAFPAGKVQFAGPSWGRVIERTNNDFNLLDFNPEAFAEHPQAGEARKPAFDRA